MKKEQKKEGDGLKDETNIETAIEYLAKWAKQSYYHYGSAYRAEKIEEYERLIKGAINDKRGKTQD